LIGFNRRLNLVLCAVVFVCDLFQSPIWFLRNGESIPDPLPPPVLRSGARKPFVPARCLFSHRGSSASRPPDPLRLTAGQIAKAEAMPPVPISPLVLADPLLVPGDIGF
jgi:hypothetical protein